MDTPGGSTTEGEQITADRLPEGLAAPTSPGFMCVCGRGPVLALPLRTMAGNTNLGAAKKAKQDEFYTQWADIEREMNAYLEYDPDVFRDKTVLLPCDDPEWSNFTKFFALHFTEFGLKKLISTSYAPESNAEGAFYQPTLFETEAPDYDAMKSRVHGRVFTLVPEDITGDGRVDIEDLRWEYLQGDGDFRSTEVTQLRDQADIIITNPPFSLFREYVAWLIEGGTKFAALGNMNAITYKEVFPSIRDNRLWLGASHFNTGMYFGVSDAFEYAESYKFERERGGMMVARVPGICWFTNIDHGRRHEPLQLMTVADNIRFSKHKEVREVGYRSYDNYDALEVPFTDAIPSDYDDVMGVPITFLDKFNPDQFEIVGRGEDIEWAKSEDCTFFTPITPELQKLHRQRDKTWRIQNPYLLDANGFARTVYKRIFIRHLTPMPKKG